MVHRIRCLDRHGDRDRGGVAAGARGGENPAARRNSQRLKRLFLAALLALLPAASFAAGLENQPALKHTILLVHGATIHGSHLNVGPFDLGDYFQGIAAHLATTGTPVKVVELSTDGTIGERAAVLKNYLDTELQGQMVNVIAHSLGGLDARYCISILHTMQIASLTTIGTPHLGSPLADWAVDQIDNYGVWYWLFRAVGYNMSSRRFLREITTEGMKRFNEKVPDSPEVRYFSVRTKGNFNEGTMSILLWFPNHWLNGQNHYLNLNGNDGLVPYDSQAWGQTIYEVGDLDHLGQMNHHELRFNSQSQDSLRLYDAIYGNLVKEGL